MKTQNISCAQYSALGIVPLDSRSIDKIGKDASHSALYCE